MKKSKLLTLGLLAGAGLLLSINQAHAADTWVKNGADWNLSQDGSLAKINGYKMLALGTILTVLVKCRQAGSKMVTPGIH